MALGAAAEVTTTKNGWNFNAAQVSRRGSSQVREFAQQVRATVQRWSASLDRIRKTENGKTKARNCAKIRVLNVDVNINALEGTKISGRKCKALTYTLILSKVQDCKETHKNPATFRHKHTNIYIEDQWRLMMKDSSTAKLLRQTTKVFAQTTKNNNKNIVNSAAGVTRRRVKKFFEQWKTKLQKHCEKNYCKKLIKCL